MKGGPRIRVGLILPRIITSSFLSKIHGEKTTLFCQVNKSSHVRGEVNVGTSCS